MNHTISETYFVPGQFNQILIYINQILKITE